MSESFRHYVLGTWFDRMLLALLLCLIGIFWMSMYQNEAQSSVSIFHGQQLLAWYPLPQNKTIELELQGHIGKSRIQIDQHGVRFLSSPCNNQYCVAQVAKQTSGQMVACVPNHLMFMIDGESSLDAILE